MIKVFSRFTALIVWVLAVMVFNPTQARAAVGDTFTSDQLKYIVLTEEDTSGTAAVSGYVGEPTTITIPDSVSHDGKTYSITSLGDDAFSWCDSLTTLTIPASVTTIAQSAFSACFSLEQVYYEGNVPETQPGFYDAAPDTLISYYKAANKTSWESVIVDDKWQGRSIELDPKEELEYQFYDDGTASVTGIGSFSDNILIIPSSVREKQKTYKVISIGNSAFTGCTNLTSVTIPDSVTSIGSSAFYRCDRLRSITIPDSVTSVGNETFYNCRSLSHIYFNGDAPILGDSVFNNTQATIYYQKDTKGWTNPWGGRQTVECDKWIIQKSVLYTYKSDKKAVVFDYMDQIEDIIIPEIISIDSMDYSVISIADSAFKNCISLKNIEIPNGLISIEDRAFSGCSSLHRITIPDTVTTIGDYVFQNDIGLTDVVIGDSVISIGSFAFEKCSSLVDIAIPDSVNSIGNSAFSGCSSLSSISIPNSVASIGNGAFFNCKNLNNIHVDPNNPVYNSTDGVLFNKNQTVLVQYPPAREGEYIIPESVNLIGNYAFAGCIGTTSLIIPEGVEEIAPNAFYKFKGLQKIQLPSTLKTIGEDAFFGCINLQEIKIPDSVTSIGAGAFANCRSLEQLDIPNYVKGIGDSAFFRCEKLKFIYIPDSCVEAGAYMFNYCHSLETAIIGAGIKEIPDGFFLGCGYIKDDYYPKGSSYGDPFNFNLGHLKEVYFLGDNPGITWDTFLLEDHRASISTNTYTTTGGSQRLPDRWVDPIQGKTPTLYYLNDKYGWYSLSYEEALNEVCDSSWGNLDNALNHCLNYEELKAKEDNFEYDDGVILSYKGNSPVVVIPDFVTEIGKNAFANCKDVYVIIVPKLVNVIGDKAFANCPHLKTVQFRGEVPMASENIFEGDHCAVYYERGISGWDAPWKGMDVLTVEGSFDSDFTYEINGLEITITGYTGTSPYLEIPSEINGYPVTQIKEEAFFRRFDIFSVYVPGSVNYVGFGAFASCRNLYSVVFEGETEIEDSAFYYCKNLTEVVLPETLDEIRAYTFSNCERLQTINIPETVTYIGDSAFYKCESLVEIIISGSVTEIGDSVFAGCVSLSSAIIGNNVEFMGDLIFAGCSNLTSITIPNGVTTIGECVFDSCNLVNVEIPDSVISIGDKAFYRCISLTNIIVPDSVISIGSNAFSGCSSLASIIIPDSVAFIGSSAFYGCDQLPSILFSTEKKILVRYSSANTETSYTIPDTVTYIADSAFYNCNSLTDVYFKGDAPTIGSSVFTGTEATIYYIAGTKGWTNPWGGRPTVVISPVTYNYYPDGTATVTGVSEEVLFFDEIKIPSTVEKDGVVYTVTAIAEKAFYGNEILTRVVVPDSVTTIGTGAFSNCSNLVSVTVGKGVTFIGNGAFFGCGSLTEIYFDGDAPELGKQVFFNTPATIYYQAGTEGWTNPWGDRPTVMIRGEIPVLTCALEGDMIRLQWTADADAVLQVSDDAVDDWTDVTEGIQTESGSCVYKVLATSKQAFYRLKML